MNRFIISLRDYLNYDVITKCEEYRRNGYAICLCSAAPILYILPFIKKEKITFDEIICSLNPSTNVIWEENIGERKMQTTLNAMDKRNFVLSVLITDHSDDLPLLLLPKEKNILVNPTGKSLKIINDNGVDYEIL